MLYSRPTEHGCLVEHIKTKAQESNFNFKHLTDGAKAYKFIGLAHFALITV